MPLDAEKEQEERTRRARLGLEQHTIAIELDGEGWQVRNGEGGTYLVRRDAGEWTCNCPDYELTCARYGVRCKHIEAVRLWLAAHQAAKERYDERRQDDADHRD